HRGALSRGVVRVERDAAPVPCFARMDREPRGSARRPNKPPARSWLRKGRPAKADRPEEKRGPGSQRPRWSAERRARFATRAHAARVDKIKERLPALHPPRSFGGNLKMPRAGIPPREG